MTKGVVTGRVVQKICKYRRIYNKIHAEDMDYQFWTHNKTNIIKRAIYSVEIAGRDLLLK